MPVDPNPSAPDSPAQAQWRINPALPTAKLAGAALLLVAGFVFAAGDPVQPVVAGLAAAGLLGWAVRDLLRPVQLRMTPAGLAVISGFAGRRELPWSAIDRISVTSGHRLGLRTEMLEIDCADSLHLFSRADLNTDPHEVAAVLRAAQQRQG